MQAFQQYIDGQFEDGSARFESTNPATGKAWATMPEAREDDVDRAVKAAQRALWNGEWPALKAAFEAWLRPDNFDADGRQKRRLEDLR